MEKVAKTPLARPCVHEPNDFHGDSSFTGQPSHLRAQQSQHHQICRYVKHPCRPGCQGTLPLLPGLLVAEAFVPW